MSDPDRDALRKALKAFDEVSAQRERSRIDDEVIVAAARRDLARVEKEAPKKSMLMQMVDWLETRERGVDERYNMDLQAAAVLRAVIVWRADLLSADNGAERDKVSNRLWNALS